MTALLGILGAATLFALLGFAASRHGTRLERGEGCHGDSCDVDGGCEVCGVDAAGSPGWWPSGK